MSYSVYFFAATLEELRDQIANDETLADRVVRRVQEQRNLTQPTLQAIRQRVESGRRGQWQSPADTLDFDSFLWMLDVLAERIDISPLLDFRNFEIWEQTGLWPILVEVPCPVPVPRSAGDIPAVGYWPAARMSQLLHEPALIGEPVNPYSRVVRLELLEVIESLAADGLDLLAVMH